MEYSLLKRRYEEAIRIADEASSFLLSHESLRKDVSSKAENDYVTLADQSTESLIRDRILASFPDDIIFGEESGQDKSGAVRWIVDPIDGTVNFMSALPNYTVSIGFEDEDGLAFGVVQVPRQHEVFYAFRGEGAYLNGNRIHTDETMPLEKGLVILVPPHRHHSLIPAYMKRMERFYDRFSDARSFGSAAFSLCYVAAGRCLGYYEWGLCLYDCAAGLVILREAGGEVRFQRFEEKWIDIIASSRSAFGAMSECADA